jgi:hypothetical protein
MMPSTNLGHVTYTQSVYNKTQKLCLGSTKTCLGSTRHILVGQLGSQGKKEQTVPFVLSAILEDPFCERTMDMEV